MRQYQPVWIKLKQTGTVSITANRRFHARIIKAVVKEKWMDFGWKLELAEKKQISLLSQISTGAVITFTLEVKSRKLIPGDLGFNPEEEDGKCLELQTKPRGGLLESLLVRLIKLS